MLLALKMTFLPASVLTFGMIMREILLRVLIPLLKCSKCTCGKFGPSECNDLKTSTCISTRLLRRVTTLSCKQCFGPIIFAALSCSLCSLELAESLSQIHRIAVCYNWIDHYSVNSFSNIWIYVRTYARKLAQTRRHSLINFEYLATQVK